MRNVENAPPASDSLARLAGIHLLNVHGCIIFDNLVENCGKGVWVYGGFGNRITNNTFLGNNYGVLIDSSADNIVTKNIAFEGWNGILLDSSEGNTLRNNDLFNNSVNFGVTGEDPAVFLNNVDLSNSVDGKKVYYLIGESSFTINSTIYPDLGAIVLVNCKDVTVENLHIDNAYGGIHLANAVNSIVTNNTVSNSTFGGIWLQFCSNCTISNNNLKPNANFGIQVELSSNIDVSKNYIEQADTNFIAFQNSSGNTITGNSLGRPFGNSLPTGIYLEFSNNTNISNNMQFGTDGAIGGIYLSQSSSNLVQSNTFGKSAPGITITQQSNYNTIANNKFDTDRGSYGVNLYQSYYNNITDNLVQNFSTGLQLDNAENNLIAKNVITSREHAAEIFMFNNNIFDSNQFLGTTDVWDMGNMTGHSPSTNIWR